MKNLKVLALFLAAVIISTGLSACGGDKKAETSVSKSESADMEDEEEADEDAEESTMEDSAEETVEDKAEMLKQVLTIGYIGTDEYDSTVYWAISEDADFGVLLVVSADESQKISFVGDIVSEGTTLTITDNSTGNSRTVDIQEATTEDGNQEAIILTDEDGDQTVLIPVEVDKVIDAIMEADAQ